MNTPPPRKEKRIDIEQQKNMLIIILTPDAV